jgi:hypothetical protein
VAVSGASPGYGNCPVGVGFFAAGGAGLAGALGSGGVVWAWSEAAKRKADRMAAARIARGAVGRGLRSTAIMFSLPDTACLFDAADGGFVIVGREYSFQAALLDTTLNFQEFLTSWSMD